MQTLVRLLLLVGTSWASASNAPEWHREVVDSTSGRFSSLQIDRSGNAHVAYMDEARTLLKYSFWDHTLRKWFTTTLDRTRGFCSLVLDSKQRPHISYLAYGDGQLNHIYWDGTSWDRQPIRIKAKDISYYTSITLDAQDLPRISYYEYWGTGEDYRLHLRNVLWNGQFWEVSTVDSTPGSGKFNAIVSDSAGNPQIAYANVKAENASLRYARWNGRFWDIDILEGATAPFYVYSVNVVLDKSGVPHITYTDVMNRLVKYATRRDGRWRLEVVDSLGDTAYPDRNGIAVDDQGQPYISYYDARRGVLKLAYRRDQKWQTEIVDQDFAGFTSSLQIDHATIWLTYADESGGLKCARRLLEEHP